VRRGSLLKIGERDGGEFADVVFLDSLPDELDFAGFALVAVGGEVLTSVESLGSFDGFDDVEQCDFTRFSSQEVSALVSAYRTDEVCSREVLHHLHECVFFAVSALADVGQSDRTASLPLSQ
jgi:hypothetical protein